MLVANARMYAVTPAAAAAWRDIIAWVAAESGVTLDIVEHPPPKPLHELWTRADLGCVFMCGWPFGQMRPRPHLLAAPIPAPARFGGRPVSFTDIVVRADSDFRTIEDTFGARVAWTLKDSHSGFNALRHYLLQFRTTDRPTLYAESVGPVINPLGALRAVVEGKAEVAPVDAFVHELFKAGGHELTRLTRTVASTPPTPFPPLVASAGVAPEVAARLRQALSRAHAAAAMRPLLERVLVERFVVPEVEDYALGGRLDRGALAAGYPMPA